MGTRDLAAFSARRLASVHPDLTVELLTEVLRRGQEANDNTTANHPKTAPGWYRWSESARAARDLLLPHGWSRAHDDGLPLTVCPDGSVRLYPASGNEDTGLAHRIPSTQRPRGEGGRRAVFDPNQYDIFPSDGIPPAPETWILLYRPFEEGDRAWIRAELSLPKQTDEDGFIVGWIERIILPEIDLTHTVSVGRDDDSESEIDVPVTRKDIS